AAVGERRADLAERRAEVARHMHDVHGVDEPEAARRHPARGERLVDVERRKLERPPGKSRWERALCPLEKERRDVGQPVRAGPAAEGRSGTAPAGLPTPPRSSGTAPPPLGNARSAAIAAIALLVAYSGFAFEKYFDQATMPSAPKSACSPETSPRSTAG